ncbi:MAG: TerC/Alx family metal homeostasis membrane protein [Deltaproteobacteria bacterium]|nr:TerC/Alx family metal homeostasis membrane protein [Deltaproteobacteria bacterium]
MTWMWVGFLAIVAVMLALDLGVFHKNAHEVSAKEALGWTVVWITLGVSFTAVIYFMYENAWFGAELLDDDGVPIDDGQPHGGRAAMRYLTAYLLEKSLSIDNIFVIALVFQRFKVPRIDRHRVLFWGVLGAIVMRGAMLLGGLWLLHKFTWLFYVFGAYLVFTGIKLLFPEKEEEEHEDSGPSFTDRLKGWFHVAPDDTPDAGHRFFVKIDGKRAITSLGLALIVIEWTDLVFALDSIPAVLAVAPEPFIVFTSNIFAILGLRSLYFVLETAVQKFKELRYALAVVLAFVGAKMILHHWVKIPTLISLAVILVSIGLAVAVSLIRQRVRRGERRLDG